MYFSFPWKTLLLVVCIVVGVFQYQKRQERDYFENHANQLAELLDPSLRSATTPHSMFERSVFETIAHLYSIPGLYENDGGRTTKEFDRLVERACEINGFSPRVTFSNLRALETIFETCYKLGIFDPVDRNIARMQSGFAPRVNSGIYTGDDLVVAYLVPPLAAASGKNQLPNVTVVPATVKTLRGDTVDTQAYRAAMSLLTAEIISDAQFSQIERIYHENVLR